MAEYRVNEEKNDNNNNNNDNNILLKDSPDFIKEKIEINDKLAELLAILERKRHDFNINGKNALTNVDEEKSSSSSSNNNNNNNNNNEKEKNDNNKKNNNNEEVSITTNTSLSEPSKDNFQLLQQ